MIAVTLAIIKKLAISCASGDGAVTALTKCQRFLSTSCLFLATFAKITEMEDKRNVIDKFKGRSESEIINELDSEDHGLVIALENTERDFNMGTIVRSANAFGVRQIYVIGRRQWNKRGAMMTDKYLHITYLATTEEFVEKMRAEGRKIIAIDNIPGSVNMSQTRLSKRAVLVFGQEGPGISAELAGAADQIVAIEQFGSTRSINVGAAATVAMYCWLQQNVLTLSRGDL